MHLIVLTILGTWFVAKANQAHLFRLTCRFRDYAHALWLAEAYTAGYFAVALLSAFVRPWGLCVTIWILVCAMVCRFRYA